ncbi:MAG: hypothetical protein F4Y60_00585 [Boseongicola sp. SB0664_bin_43]|uniref:Uncharacterized protein n=1 Tax=Boseongicola sp. SB0664_bin_43 TaxID=2604844 RepID=A0A6B0XXW1_9RHOB|nr:hypothetical protein [Boseongicola sp. SB0664_bin_43]
MRRACETIPLSLAGAILAAALLLSACGGGAGSSAAGGEGATPPIPAPVPMPPSPPPYPLAKPQQAEIRVSYRFSGRHVGIGPAFANERPYIDDLETRSLFGSYDVGSGRWRDGHGRDGSASAAEVVRFLRSFQTQQDREGGGDLVFIDFGVQKSLRIGNTARASERRAVVAALRNMNTSLPWRHRILLGPDISESVAPEDIPDDEIHIHFTDGKALWPEVEDGEEYERNVLGIGGSNFDREAQRALGGYTYIDRQAVGRGTARMEFVVTHELLHAWGMGAHVDPGAYPDAILVPVLPRHLNEVPLLWLTVEGEALLAEIKIAPGTRVSDLTVADLGPWDDDGFHLLGQIGLGGTDAEAMQFGAGYRNGLGRPWIWGPVPSTRLRANPEMSGRRTATWAGSLLGFSGAGRPVAGDAEIGIDIASLQGRADFTELESWARETHPGEPGTGHRWGDGDLGYTIGVRTEAGTETFVSTFASGDDPGVVTGAFVGARHEGAAGVLEHPDLSAAFGATR